MPVSESEEVAQDIKKRQELVEGIKSLLLAKKVPFFVLWFPQLIIVIADSDSPDGQHLVFWFTFRSWMLWDAVASLIFLLLEGLHEYSASFERERRDRWNSILESTKRVLYQFKLILLVVGFVKYVALEFYSGIDKGLYKTFATIYFDAVLFFIAVWFIVLWKQYEIDCRKKKLNRLYSEQINQGIILNDHHEGT